MTEKDAQMRDKDREIAGLKEQLAVQNQAMARMRSMTETLAARMTAFEQQQQRLGVATQTVSLGKDLRTLGE